MTNNSNTATLDPTTENAKPKTARKSSECLCACGEMTFGRYRPGHDARHVSYLVKATMTAKGAAKAKIAKEVATLSDKLKAKFDNSLARAEAAASAKTATANKAE